MQLVIELRHKPSKQNAIAAFHPIYWDNENAPEALAHAIGIATDGYHRHIHSVAVVSGENADLGVWYRPIKA